MNIMFTMEESNLFCIFAGEYKNELIKDIEMALSYLKDTEMAELSGRVAGKLRYMSDEEFARLGLAETE